MNSANKDFGAFLKAYTKTKDTFEVGGDNKQYYDKINEHKKHIFDLVTRAGFVKELSKDNVLRLILIQSRERFMAEHTFYIYMTREINL